MRLNFKKIFIIIVYQFIVLCLLSLLVSVKYGYDIALSGVFGGITSMFSSFLFFIVVFFNDKNSSPKFVVRRFYLAGLLKIVLLIVVFSILFSLGLQSPGCFFIFFFFMQLSFWFGCFFLMGI